MTQVKRKQKESSLFEDIPRRLLTICVGVPILWRLIWWYPNLRTLFFQGAHAVMCLEWARMTKCSDLGMIIFPFVSVASVNCKEDTLFLLCALFAVHSFTLASDAPPTALSAQLQATAGVLLITIPNRAWLQLSHHFAPTVSLLLTVWNCDTGALLAGRLGKAIGTNWSQPEWLRQASPNKTVEGLVGGFLAGVGTFCALPWFWDFMASMDLVPPGTEIELTTLDKWERFKLGCALSGMAILGDYWESILKRAFEVKDTGSLLPGHGGVLDRFDSSLMAVILYAHKIQQKG